VSGSAIFEYVTNGQTVEIVYSGATKGWIPNLDKNTSSMFTATGGTITYAGGYTIHSFTSSGTFTPNISGTVDYLVVAGGGSGNDGYINTTGIAGGGGGAGGYLSESSFSVSAIAYTVEIGAGGAYARVSDPSPSGSNTLFGEITTIGGGGGGKQSRNGAAGGSGGGGGGNSTG